MSMAQRFEPLALAARLTAPGRGAVASIGLSAIDVPQRIASHFHPAGDVPLEDTPLGDIRFGHWGPPPGEQVVLARLDQRRWELHCHGGPVMVDRVLEGLGGAGFAIVAGEEYAARVGPRAGDRLALEAERCLAEALTWPAARVLLDQLGGALRGALDELRRAIESDRLQAAGRIVDALLAWADFGRHLTQPWRVVLVGPPNVGKSSLINALLGYGRAIVFDQPGTTRDLVTARTALGGWPVELIDTAGIRETSDPLEAEGVAQALAALSTADLGLWVVDLACEASAGPPRIERLPPLLRVGNKCDLVAEASGSAEELLPTSATAGAGIAELAREIVARLVPRQPPPGTALPFTERQVHTLEEVRQALASRRGAEAVAQLNALCGKCR